MVADWGKAVNFDWIKKIDWRRGLFRVWIVASVAWTLAVTTCILDFPPFPTENTTHWYPAICLGAETLDEDVRKFAAAVCPQPFMLTLDQRMSSEEADAKRESCIKGVYANQERKRKECEAYMTSAEGLADKRRHVEYEREAWVSENIVPTFLLYLFPILALVGGLVSCRVGGWVIAGFRPKAR